MARGAGRSFFNLQDHLKERHSQADFTETPFEWDTPIGKTKFNNLVYTFDPEAPRKIVIAAHFDSKYFPDFPANQVCSSPLLFLRRISCLLDDETKGC